MSGIMITPNSHMNPVYGSEEISSVTDYINTGGWIMEHTKTREMERMICEYTGAKYAHMVPSATMGLLLASMLSDIKPGEHFNVSAYTQAATANGAILMGGVPDILDVDPESYTLDFSKVTNRVVYVSSINGRSPSNYGTTIQKLRDIGCFVIEDAAQALGSWHGNKHIGTMGDVGVFSFGAPKLVSTGQGGCIVTNSKDTSRHIHSIKNFGRTVGVGEVYNVMGMNFKFTDLQASFGIPQMHKLTAIVKRKRALYKLYRELLGGIVEFVDTDLKFITPTYPEILVDNRDELSAHLSLNKIGNRACYYSLSSQPFHSQWKTHTPVTDYIGSRGLQIPGQSNLIDDDIRHISNVIASFYKP